MNSRLQFKQLISPRTLSKFLFAVFVYTALNTNLAHASSSQKIIFTSDRDNDDEIYSVDRDGTNQVNLTNSPLSSDNSAYVSPDGTKIAFLSDRDGGTDIYAMNIDGSGLIRLTETTSNAETMSYWFPDNSKILYTARANEDPFDYTWNLYVMNADGTNKIQVASNAVARETYPSVSPDGQKIVYAKIDNAGVPQVHLVNTDGTGEMQVTNDANNHSNLMFSGDSTKIAYASNDSSALPILTSFYTYNLNTSQTEKIIDSSTVRPIISNWTPDNQYIIANGNFSSTNVEDYNLYITPPTPGSSLVPIGDLPNLSDGSDPQYYSLISSTELVYRSIGQNNGADLYLLDISSGTSTNLTNLDGFENVTQQASSIIHPVFNNASTSSPQSESSAPKPPKTGTAILFSTALTIVVFVVASLSVFQADKLYTSRKNKRSL